MSTVPHYDTTGRFSGKECYFTSLNLFKYSSVHFFPSLKAKSLLQLTPNKVYFNFFVCVLLSTYIFFILNFSFSVDGKFTSLPFLNKIHFPLSTEFTSLPSLNKVHFVFLSVCFSTESCLSKIKASLLLPL